MRCVCGSGDEEELEKCTESLFSVMTKCVFILTPCNISAISTLIVMNNIRKELVMIVANYGIKSQQIRAQNQSSSVTNQSTKSIQLIILILTIWKDIASNYDYITNFSITNKGRKYLSYWAHEKEFIINNKLGSSSFFFLFFFFFFSKIKVWKSLKKIWFNIFFILD